MLKVDKTKCLKCGACVNTCEEVYGFDDEGIATIVSQPTEETMDRAMEAKENCPTSAIEETN